MSHPFQTISAGNYVLLFLPLLALTILLTAVLSAIPLKPGIVEFELAGSTSKVREIVSSWGEAGQIRAAFNLGLDFLYLVIYSTTIGLACIWVTNAIQAYGLPLTSVGILLAWGQWLAALLDVVENIALAIILFGSVTAPWPQIAKCCAIPKFGLVILGLLYAGVGAFVRVGTTLFQSR